MNRDVAEGLVGCLSAILIFATIVACSVGVAMLIGYGVVWVFSGFGVTLPYWHTTVGIFLFSLILGGIFRNRQGGK